MTELERAFVDQLELEPHQAREAAEALSYWADIDLVTENLDLEAQVNIYLNSLIRAARRLSAVLVEYQQYLETEAEAETRRDDNLEMQSKED